MFAELGDSKVAWNVKERGAGSDSDLAEVKAWQSCRMSPDILVEKTRRE